MRQLLSRAFEYVAVVSIRVLHRNRTIWMCIYKDIYFRGIDSDSCEGLISPKSDQGSREADCGQSQGSLETQEEPVMQLKSNSFFQG